MSRAADLEMDLDAVYCETRRPRNGVVTLSGYGIRVTVERGHLHIEDGIGAERRRARFSRVNSGIKRLVALGHSGIVSLEALRWLHDLRASFVQIDTDGELIVVAGPPGLNDSRLRRAQALACANGAALEIGRDLIRKKLRGQLKVVESLSASAQTLRYIGDCIDELAKNESPEELRRTESRAALAYWSAWREVPINFESHASNRVPDHWRIFGQRHSLLSAPSPRRAINPANAMLNYLYAILEAEARIAALRMGLDPGLGLLHADQRSRDSLPCDLMEPVRPKVDAFVLDLLKKRSFTKSDLFETREGICRLMPPLSRQLVETSPVWAKELGPVTEQVAQTLFARHHDERKIGRPKSGGSHGAGSYKLPTPLTQSNRSRGREPYRRKRPVESG